MSLSGNLNGIDMNNAVNLELFSQILLFKNDLNRAELVFMQRSNAEQRNLQTIAHSQALVYEYSAAKKMVRISRPEAECPSDVPTSTTSGSGHLESISTADNTYLGLEGQDDNAAQTFGAQLHSEEMPGSGMYSVNSAIGFQDVVYDTRIFDVSATVSEDMVIPDLSDPGTANETSTPDEEPPSKMGPAIVQNTASSQGSNPFWGGADSIYYYQSSNTCGCNFEPCVCPTQYPLGLLSEINCPHTLWGALFPGACVLCFPTRVQNVLGAWNEPEDISTTRDTTRQQLTHDSKESEYTPEVALFPRAIEAGPYRCDLCSRSYFRAEHITRHRKTDHVGSRKKYFCYNCPTAYDSNIALSIHKMSCKSNEGSGGGSPQNMRGGVDSRGGSVHSGGSTGYGEFVFDTRSAHSGSQASVCSANSVGSGRRGPLSRLARAGMNAVKEVGACWRCKFLKKSCDTYSPCAMCPKDSKSKWENVGCKRGNFHPPSFRLCRRPFAKLSENQLEVQVIDTKISSLKLGSRIDPRTQKDSADANLDASPALPVQDQFGEVHIRQQFYQYLDSTIAERSPAASAQLLPLEQCALAILWNFIECPMARQILNDGGSLDDLTRLLPFAIAYQAELQEDQLIAQSLICLRTCAEALRVKAAGLLGTCWHSSCGSQNCKIECVANLSMHLGLYTQELSRVFFKKENVHHRGPWFLSTFYSFCIQSYVRRVLVELTKDAEKKGGPDPGFDACIAYEEAIWQIGRRDKATDDAPILLDATYPLFCDGLEYEYPVKHKTFFGMAAEKWKGLSPVKRESSLRQALLVSVEYLRVKLIPYTQAQNPLKCSQSVFGPMLKRSRLSPDMIADLIPKVPAVAKEAEPDQYLYFPVRLFIALNSGTLDPLCGLFDRNSEFGALRVHIEAARRAVAQPSWDAQGIRTSSDYLKALFQDDGRNLDQHLLVGEQMHDEESMPQPCDANREGRCSVCMNHVHTNEDITFLPCLHWFHESCVVAWLQEINTCPSCRTVIYQEPGSSSTKRKRSPTLTSQQDEAFSRPLTVDDSTPGPRMLSSNSSGTPPSRPRLQCWEHGCNGRMFSTFSNLFRHKREMSRAPKEEMPSLHRNA